MDTYMTSPDSLRLGDHNAEKYKAELDDGPPQSGEPFSCTHSGPLRSSIRQTGSREQSRFLERKNHEVSMLTRQGNTGQLITGGVLDQ